MVRTRSCTYLALILAAAGLWARHVRRADEAVAAQRAFENQLDGIGLTVSGTVERLLQDDTRPPRHQRFVIRTHLRQTLEVAHNVDIAPRVPVRVGDRVTVRGTYEWNPDGGVLHFTHASPRSPGGWVRVERTGRTYR
jgi:hypothetical protein